MYRLALDAPQAITSSWEADLRESYRSMPYVSGWELGK